MNEILYDHYSTYTWNENLGKRHIVAILQQCCQCCHDPSCLQVQLTMRSDGQLGQQLHAVQLQKEVIGGEYVHQLGQHPRLVHPLQMILAQLGHFHHQLQHPHHHH